jgi:hypothetical protein
MEFLSHPAIPVGIIVGFVGLLVACYRRHGHKYGADVNGSTGTRS